MKRTFRFLLILSAIMLIVPGFAATRQSVISNGTKVAAATETKSSPCQEKYNACMDAGCMLDNEFGGRCQCSNQIKDLNQQLSIFENKRELPSVMI